MKEDIRLAVVSFAYNHPTGIRNIKIFEELSKFNDVKIDIITVSNWRGYKEKRLNKYKNLRIHFLEPIFLSKTSFQFRYYMGGLFKKIKKINPDIIYIINEPVALNTFLATIYSKILRKKIMCFAWDNLFIKRNIIVRLYEKFVLNNIDHIIAGSSDAKNVLIKKGYSKDKIQVMPVTGIDTSFFKKNSKNVCKKLNIQKEKTCLFLGRLEDEKGIKYILDAKKKLDEKKKIFTFLFVGNGKWYDKLKKISPKDKKIKVLKWVKYDELPKVYNSARLFLYPSVPLEFWEEQFGYSMIEAMSCGLPVIASDMSGPREIIKNGEDGFIIESKNAEMLAKKIIYLMENKKIYDKFSRNTIKNVKRFDNKVIARRLHSKIKTI